MRYRYINLRFTYLLTNLRSLFLVKRFQGVRATFSAVSASLPSQSGTSFLLAFRLLVITNIRAGFQFPLAVHTSASV